MNSLISLFFSQLICCFVCQDPVFCITFLIVQFFAFIYPTSFFNCRAILCKRWCHERVKRGLFYLPGPDTRDGQKVRIMFMLDMGFSYIRGQSHDYNKFLKSSVPFHWIQDAILLFSSVAFKIQQKNFNFFCFSKCLLVDIKIRIRVIITNPNAGGSKT